MSQSDVLHDFSPEEVDALFRREMAYFVRGVFAEVSPGVDLVWAPYLDLICARLGEVVFGDLRNLIITMPPRHLKSICVSVALPAFFLGHNPSRQVLAISYGQELAKIFAEDTRKVMESAFYQHLFDTRLAKARQPIHALTTTDGGIRRATSIDGTATGVGADLMIFDDPQKPNEALSEAIRRSTNQAYENTFRSRRNDPATCRTVIVMQRLHEDDFVGHVRGLGGDWEVLNLPAIAEADELYSYKTYLGDHTYGRKEGEALHPRRVPLTELSQIRAEIGEAAWASQYMQRPAPAGGGIVNIAWFKTYRLGDKPSTFDQVIQSWDTASKIASSSDYSVCTTWGVKEKQVYLLDVFRDRLLYPDLKRKVVELSRLYSATRVIIEDHASGMALLQDFRAEGVPRIEGMKPRGDKQTRMAAQSARIEGGFVHLPEKAHWLAEYLHELSVFPNGKYDDQVDSTSQGLDAVSYSMVKGWAYLELAIKEVAEKRLREGPVISGPQYQPGSMEYAYEQNVINAAREGRPVAVPKPGTIKVLRESKFQPGSLEWAREEAAITAARNSRPLAA
jgi:predicted phage terminase large subunit-like protein